MTHDVDVKRQWDGLERDKRVATLLVAHDRVKAQRLDALIGLLSLAIVVGLVWLGTK